MNISNIIFKTKLLTYSIATCLILIEAYPARGRLSEEHSLTQLLQDREIRLKQFNLLSTKAWKYEVMMGTGELLLRRDDVSEMSKNAMLPYSLISIVHDTLANRSWNYRREAYQLIRDLDIEILPDLYDHLPCIKETYMYNMQSNEGINHLMSIIQLVGKCLNLTYVTHHGNKMDQADTKVRTVSVPKLTSGAFINATPSSSPIIQRIRRILNALIQLLDYVNYDKEFIGGKAEWYGQASKSNHEKWMTLANYVPLVEDAVPFSITENDYGEEFALLEERRLRFITFNDNGTTREFNGYLPQIDKVLKALYSNEESVVRSSSTFPQLDLPSATPIGIRIEMFELVKDLLMELGSTVYEKLPFYTTDFLGIKYVHKPFTNDTGIIDFRDKNFTSTIYGELKFLAKFFNFTYVDSVGNVVEEINGKINGKYIYPLESVESSASRRLRHIINGFERLYFNILKEEGIKVPLIISREERSISCKYRLITAFISDGISEHDLRPQWLMTRILSEPSSVPLNLRTLIQLIQEYNMFDVERKFAQSGEFVLLKEARTYLVNATSAWRARIYNYIVQLYAQEWKERQYDFQDQKDLWIAKNRLTSIWETDRTNCLHIFLCLLQLTGKQYDLKYIDKYGEEVSIDSTLVGNFVYAHSSYFPILRKKTSPHVFSIKYLLNEIIMSLLNERYRGPGG